MILFLAASVMGSALGVVYAKYQTRKLFVELQTLQKIRDEMNVEWGQLQLEQSTWGTNARVEGIARSKLDMIMPPIDAVVIVKP
ncbi:MAG TPA: cell division protein FtsL [Gammaproteobacteria bacterium]|nr:cell division protein FtsL [Gammaproteobacteria bacterium]